MVAPAYQLTNFAGTTDPAGGILTLIENQMTIAGWVFIEEYAFTQSATARVMRVWKNPSTLNFAGVDYYVGFVKDAVAGIRLAMRVFENWDAVNKVIQRPCIQGSATHAIAGYWASIAYGNGTFVILSGGGNTTTAVTCATSVNNGVTWTMRSMPAAQNWTSVAYGNGVFVAVSGSASNVAATSPDGITWTSRTLPSTLNWTSVTYGNSVFVAISGSTSNVAATSPDGITWTSRTMSSAQSWNYVTYANGLFVAVAASYSSANTSPDGITWTSRSMSSAQIWNSVAFGNSVFVAVANSSSSSTSPTGISWTVRTMPSALNWASVAYGNGVFVAVASGSALIETQNAAISSDGITWAYQTMPVSAPWVSIIYANGIFVAVAANGNIATSSDGSTWSTQSPPKTAYSAGLGNWLPTGATTPLMVDTPTSTALASMTNYDVVVLVSKSYIVVGCCLNGTSTWIFQWVLGMFSPSYSDSKIDYPPLIALDPTTTAASASSGVARSMRSMQTPANVFSVGVGPEALLFGYVNQREASTYTNRACRAALGSNGIANGFVYNAFRGWLLDAIIVSTGSLPKVGDTVTVGIKTYTILGYINSAQLNFITTGVSCALAFDVTAGT